MRRTENYHNTPEQIEEYLRDALDMLDALGPPDDLRVAVFEKAVDLRSGKSITMEQVGTLPNLAIPSGGR